MITEAARRGRRSVRPFFQKSRLLAFVYDVFTFLLTRVYLAYVTAPFVLLTLESSLKLYTRLYFFGHVQCLVAIVAFPLLFSGATAERTSKSKSLSTTTMSSKINGHGSKFGVDGDQLLVNGKAKES